MRVSLYYDIVKQFLYLKLISS